MIIRTAFYVVTSYLGGYLKRWIRISFIPRFGWRLSVVHRSCTNCLTLTMCWRSIAISRISKKRMPTGISATKRSQSRELQPTAVGPRSRKFRPISGWRLKLSLRKRWSKSFVPVAKLLFRSPHLYHYVPNLPIPFPPYPGQNRPGFFLPFFIY